MRQNNIGTLFIITGMLFLVASLFFGLMGASVYIWPDGAGRMFTFAQIRPLHVSLAIFWILFTATGAVYSSMNHISHLRAINNAMAFGQLMLMTGSAAAIVLAYLGKHFGGREYLEFPPHYAIFIASGFIIFLINYIQWVRKIKSWPVYMWMWLTGIVFFIITFGESYLWLFPSFAADVIKDLTVQWKAGGSIVGSWNMLVYGTGLFLMEKVSGNQSYSKSGIAFLLYFLGLTNLMFNWGHHIYLLPTAAYIRYVSYAISMTEWVLLARIIYLWKKSMVENRNYFSHLSVRFLYIADIWVLLNLALAIVMSIPGLNLYTHGTHITVAHAMGATIGINSMILLAAASEFGKGVCILPAYRERICGLSLKVAHLSLIVFWLSLIGAGLQKAIWLHSELPKPFSSMMKGLSPYFIVFGCSGFVLALALTTIVATLVVSYTGCIKYTYVRKGNIAFTSRGQN
ncbi:MAG: cbb3-type cytochrome c oxidase subunit I [Bacteroidetes bacterium]|nr:MAG: cbb3-type cytochrome c oxidase subunit I [Bacteroidota bacterium]